MLPTDLTVSAVVERHERFLTLEKRVCGVFVLTQPSVHMETDESPERAVIRAGMRDTGCELAVSGLLGIYLWIHPQTRQQYLRIAYTADLVRENVNRQLDEPVRNVHWYSLGDIRKRSRELQSPVVQRCIEDYVVGKRQSDELLQNLAPIQHNVAAIITNACLV